MSIIVKITYPLRQFTDGAAEVQLIANDVADCLRNLEIHFPAIKDRLWDEDGKLHGFINVYVNGQDVRLLQGLSTPLKTGDEVSVVPALAGG